MILLYTRTTRDYPNKFASVYGVEVDVATRIGKSQGIISWSKAT